MPYARSSATSTTSPTPRAARHRGLLLAALLLVTTLLPGVALAGPPTTMTSQGADAFCELDTGFASVFVLDEGQDAFVDLSVETSDANEYLFGGTEDFSFDGTDLQAQVEVFRETWDDDGEPVDFTFVGIATIQATFTPIGESETTTDRFRDGNRWVSFTDVFQAADVTGSVVLDGVLDLDLADCSGGVFTSTTRTTNPTAYNNRTQERFLDCGLDDGSTTGFLFAQDGDFGQYLDLYLSADDGTSRYGFGDRFTWSDTELSGAIDLYDDETGEPAGSAMVTATLTSLGVSTSDVVFQAGRAKVVEETFAVDGTVSVDGAELELLNCFAAATTTREHVGNPQGPKPGGKAPANDAPAGAIPLTAKGVSAQTRGAANPPEADCTIQFEDEGGEFEEFVPLGKTVWYVVTGTGGPITLDTAGSDFDTVIAVYDADLDQLSCVDDVGGDDGFTLQARTTIDTEAGATYLVQVGGFGWFGEDGDESSAEFGHLRLTRR